MLEILRQNISSKLRHVPNNKAIVTLTPRHHGIGRWIIHHIIRLTQKRRRRIPSRRRRRCSFMNSVHFPLHNNTTSPTNSAIHKRSIETERKIVSMRKMEVLRSGWRSVAVKEKGEWGGGTASVK